MSFSQLLSASTSLFGVRSTDTPYRMRKGTFLPKFEPVKNPFAIPPKPDALPLSQGGAPAGPAAPAYQFSSAPLQTSLLFEAKPSNPESAVVSAPSPVVKPLPIAEGSRPSSATPGGAEWGKASAPGTDLSKLVPVYSVKEAAKLKPSPSASTLPHERRNSTNPESRIEPQNLPKRSLTPSPPDEGGGRGGAYIPSVHGEAALVSAPSLDSKAVSPQSRPETTIARVGAPKPPQPARDGEDPAAAPAKPGKEGPVVGLMDASPLGLKTGIAPKPAQPDRSPSPQPGSKSNFLAALVSKLNPMAYFRDRPVAKPRLRSWQTRSVVQGELSLENVKVIRNDLSDTDLEVIPSRLSAKATPADSLLQPVTHGEDTSFGRLTSRFFGQGQPQVR